jgi:hypothetical protein
VLQNPPHNCWRCTLPSAIEWDDARWTAVAWDGVRWIVVACGDEVRSQIQATNLTNVIPTIHDAGSRVSQLTTRIVNAFQTNRATQLFQVVSGGRDRIGRHALSTCRERNSILAAVNLRPDAKNALRSHGRQGRCAPLGGAFRWSASLTAAPLRADGHAPTTRAAQRMKCVC